VRVVIDGGTWPNSRGFGRFTRELVGALAAHGRHEYTLMVDPGVTRASVPEPIRMVYAGVAVSPSQAASADGWRSPSDVLRMSRALASEPGDLLFFPCVYTFVPVLTRKPVVTGVHDTIAERYPSLIFPNQRARLFWTLKMRAALWQSTRIVAVSDYASRCVHDVLGVPTGRLRSINEAPAAAFRPVDDRAAILAVRRALGVAPDARVIVYVGGLAPHKNLARVLRAFGRLVKSDRFADATFVLVGQHASDVFHSDQADLREQAAQLPAGRVVFAGALTDPDLVLLLNGACALVLASLDEGFGLPGVEAAACGTPVVATRNSAMPEVLGDAALYVDPVDEHSIGDALERVLSDTSLKARIGPALMARAGAMTWQRAATSLEAIFEDVLAARATP
jgi:glycosyltransferase involved in cell wall biosynthesis